MEDMPKEDFLKVVDTILPHINPNKVLITFSGGEPLMRKDLEECGLELYRRGFPWGLVSNGMSLTKERLTSLLAAGLHSISISLDGFAEQHNQIRGNAQSFDNALEALKMIAKEKELTYDAVTCVTPALFPYLEDFKNFLFENGILHWQFYDFSGRSCKQTSGFTTIQTTNPGITGVHKKNSQGKQHFA